MKSNQEERKLNDTIISHYRGEEHTMLRTNLRKLLVYLHAVEEENEKAIETLKNATFGPKRRKRRKDFGKRRKRRAK